LISNAAKFTEQGEIEIRVTPMDNADESVCLRFEVRDTGIGIGAEALGQVFDSFTQADGSTTRKYGGTGLGLTISRQLVEMMAGEIGVDSELGRGSTFWFTAYFGKQPIPAGASDRTPLDLKGLRVLIVDDNATNRDILHHQLSAWGMANTAAEDGPQALGMLRAAAEGGEPYKLALLDMMMPGMDGLELAGAIQGNPATADVSLIMLTSAGLPADGPETQQAGIDAYLSKPVRPSHLFDEIARQMRRRGDPKAKGTPLEELAPPTPIRLEGRVLLAEDNPVNQEVAVGMLESLGCSVDAVADGQQALQAIFDHAAYDLVLMDCMMPVMDGYEATRAIRATEGRQGHIPIVAITANVLEGDREQCLAAGMDDYLSKPFSLDELQAVLHRWLPEAREESGVPAASACRQEDAPASANDDRDRAPLEQRPNETLNPKTLDTIRALGGDGRPDILGRAVESYFSHSPSVLASLRNAVSQADVEGIRSAAHSLKSSSANLGAERTAALSKDLEVLARAGSTEGAEQLLESIVVEYESAREALAAALEPEVS
jgi:CheY-like chemotaxis protein/HPt (histidine-containing phosphotransfer) domain-containing protein